MIEIGNQVDFEYLKAIAKFENTEIFNPNYQHNDHNFYYKIETNDMIIIECINCKIQNKYIKKFQSKSDYEMQKDKRKYFKKIEAYLDYLTIQKTKFYCPNCGEILLDKMIQCYSCNQQFKVKKMKKVKGEDHWTPSLFFFMISFVIIFPLVLLLTNDQSISLFKIFSGLMISFIISIVVYLISYKFGTTELIEKNETIEKYFKEMQKIRRKKRKLEIKLKDLDELE